MVPRMQKSGQSRKLEHQPLGTPIISMNENSFLTARAKAALANEEWSRDQLGDWVAVLDLGCTVMELCAKEIADYLAGRGDSASQGERAISLLAMLAVARAGNVCALLLQGYPPDAGALLRGLLEIEAMQDLLASDADTADSWMRNKEIKVATFLRTIRKNDPSFGQAWRQLGTVVHPNRKAVINQVDEVTGRALLGGGGARRPEQLFKLAVNFGVQAKREIQILERTFGIAWPRELTALVRNFELRLDEMHTEVFLRWPGSETID